MTRSFPPGVAEPILRFLGARTAVGRALVVKVAGRMHSERVANCITLPVANRSMPAGAPHNRSASLCCTGNRTHEAAYRHADLHGCLHDRHGG